MFKKIQINNKFIIISTFLFVLASMIFLSVQEKKQSDINSKDTWMLYFQDAKSSSLDFSIENHSKNKNFHYSIIADKNTISQTDVSIENGQTLNIPVSVPESNGKKITIEVEGNNQQKEIYKIF